MRPAVSILTAAYEPDPRHLAEAWESVQEQDGIRWEWVIQVDGSEDELARWLPRELWRDERVRVAANGRRFGVATTRNLGLVRCRADHVQHLDQDDLLQPGALEAAVRTLRHDGRLAFCFGDSLHLFPDGRLEPRPQYEPRYPPGPIEPGEVTASWRRGDGHGVVVNNIMWRKEYLYAYGGWTALPAWADYGIVFPVTERHPVAFFDQVTLHYRRHPGQASIEAKRFVEAQRPFIPTRLDAMRRI